MLNQKLQDFYEGLETERCGFVLTDGSIVEVSNVSETPEEAFAVFSDDILPIEDEIIASWHTHPKHTSNLSDADFDAFSNWPSWRHIIIGSDGISCYSVTASGDVIRDEAEDFAAWKAEKALP
jgi:proteasome lid subunit RPN8/RPN11